MAPRFETYEMFFLSVSISGRSGPIDEESVACKVRTLEGFFFFYEFLNGRRRNSLMAITQSTFISGFTLYCAIFLNTNSFLCMSLP